MGPPSVSAGCERLPGSKGKGEGSQRGKQSALPGPPRLLAALDPLIQYSLDPLAKALLTHALILPAHPPQVP